MLLESQLVDGQQAAIDHLYESDETFLIAPKGFGKCVVGYTAIAELVEDARVNRVLVVSTAQVCSETWALEASKWSHLQDVSSVCLTGLDAENRKWLLESTPDIVICNFELLPWLFETYPDHGFDGLLVDEITKLKAVGGSGYKRLRKQLKHFTWTCAMTANPVAQESADIYGQMLIVDKGKRLDTNQDRFLRKYFMQMDYEGREWDFQPGGRERLAAAIADVMYVVDDTEYEASLPPLVDYEIEVEMPESTRELYVTLARDDFVMIGDSELEAPNAAVTQAKLHQMANGCVYITNEIDEGEETVSFERETAELNVVKLAVLSDLIKQIDGPVLVAYTFDFERIAIENIFGFPMYSAKISKKKRKKLRDAWDAGELKGLLVHPKSAGHGLNLQYGPGHTVICLSYFWSADMWDQLPGRLRRRGQKAKVVNRYTLVTRNSVEDCVIKPRLESREEGSERFNTYLKGLKK